MTAIALEIKISATNNAFALWCCGGNKIVTWGSRDAGGDNSALHGQSRNVKHVQAAKDGAFAAILADGSVVTWGDPDAGGNSSEVQDQLKGVQQVHATAGAFAAILADGSVVTWGSPLLGGNSSEVQGQLRNVRRIEATQTAFAAILSDGSVVTWGQSASGGDSSGRPRPAQLCAGHSSCRLRIRGDLGGWLRGRMGSSRFRW